MRVEQILAETSTHAPADIAVAAGKLRLSYGDLNRASDRLAAAMVARGVACGDRIAVFMGNTWEAVVTTFGIMKAGAVFVPVDPATGSSELAGLLNRAKASTIVTQARLGGTAGSAMASAPSVKLAVLAGGDGSAGGRGCLRFEDAIRTYSPAPGKAGCAEDAATIFDGDQTVSHEHVLAASDAALSVLATRRDDVVLSAFSIAEPFGLAQILAVIQRGGRLIVDAAFVLPQAIFRAMDDEGVTGLAVSASVAEGIAGTETLLPGRFPRLRYVATGPAARPTDVARLQALFPDARIVATDTLNSHPDGPTSKSSRSVRTAPRDLRAPPMYVGAAREGGEVRRLTA